MSDSPLIIKSKEFALQIIRVCNEIKSTKKENVLTNQLIRSGTSVGGIYAKHFTLTEKPILLPNYKGSIINVVASRDITTFIIEPKKTAILIQRVAVFVFLWYNEITKLKKEISYEFFRT